MNCIVCFANVPDDVSNCPRCGDHVGKWRIYDSHADGFLADGLRNLENGQELLAAVAFAKSSVLQPKSWRSLAALGQILKRLDCSDAAATYLTRAVKAAQLQRSEHVETLQRLLVDSGVGTKQHRHVQGLLGLPDVKRDGSGKGDADALDKGWAHALEAEQRGSASLAILPELTCLEGPWNYVLGLSALLGGDDKAAQTYMLQSMQADSSRRNAEIYFLVWGAKNTISEELIKVLQSAGRDAQDILETLQIAVRAALQTSQWDVADALFQAIDKLDCEPELLESLYLTVSDALHNSNQNDMAIACISRGVEQLPDSWPLCESYAAMLDEAGEKDRVVGLISSFQERHPDVLATWQVLVDLCWREKDFAGALERLRPGLENDGLQKQTREAIYYMAGVSNEQLKNVDEAKRHYEAALEADPESARAKDALANIT